MSMRDQILGILHRNYGLKGQLEKSADEISALQCKPTVSIEVFQHDWMPGFASFLDEGTIDETAKAHVNLNVGSLLAAVQEKDLDSRDLPYMVAESLMHEVIHVLEAWANEEFSEDRVEELLTKYREKYSRNTVWQYTGAEPTLNQQQTDGG